MFGVYTAQEGKYESRFSERDHVEYVHNMRRDTGHKTKEYQIP